MKRIECLLLVLCLLLSLCACGKPAASEEPQEEETADLSFTTKDLDSKTVVSASLFAKSQVTVLNLWATWCGPCVRELPELQELYDEYRTQGVEVVGILLDGTEDTAVQDAIDIMRKAGVTYPVLLPCQDMGPLLTVQYIPTTLFVDSRGNLVGEAVVGADIQACRDTLDQLLTQGE